MDGTWSKRPIGFVLSSYHFSLIANIRENYKGLCHYCGQQFSPAQLSMDHIVPLARSGKSTKGNTVPACVECNQKKKLETPAEATLKKLWK